MRHIALIATFAFIGCQMSDSPVKPKESTRDIIAKNGEPDFIATEGEITNSLVTLREAHSFKEVGGVDKIADKVLFYCGTDIAQLLENALKVQRVSGNDPVSKALNSVPLSFDRSFRVLIVWIDSKGQVKASSTPEITQIKVLAKESN